jgi:MbtH protein
MNSDDRDDTKYKVVMNDKEQYSIWIADRPLPDGWRDAAKSGSKLECLAYIKEVWTDMRPLSLRDKMKSLVGVGIPELPGVHLNGDHVKSSGPDNEDPGKRS